MAHDNLFKFITIRAPQMAEDASLERNYARYDKTSRSPLHEQIAELQGKNKRQQATEIALRHLASAEYVGSKQQSYERAKFIFACAEYASAKNTVEKVKECLKIALDAMAEDYLNLKTTQKLKDDLWDGCYAQFFAPEGSPEDRDLIYAGIRGIHFLEVIVREEKETSPNPIPLDKLHGVRITIPNDLSLFPETEMLSQENNSSVLQDLKKLNGKLLAIQNAAEDIKNNDRIYAKTKDDDSTSPAQPSTKTDFEAFLKTAQILPKVDPEVLDLLPTLKHFEARTDPKPWLLQEFGDKQLKQGTKKLLKEYENFVLEMEAPEVVETLENTITNDVLTFFRKLSPAELSLIAETEEIKTVLEVVPVPFTKTPSVKTKVQPQAQPGPVPGSAAARGIRPLGIGDLLVVNEQLLRYEAGEIAHIENVLKSEFKNRKHRRLRQTEEIITIEAEEIEESEKDLQTTERFELQKETQKTIESDLNFKAGVTVSGSYGTVSFSASSDFATSTSQSESNRHATTYAKDVTERSLSRLIQRVREERTRRTLEEFEEINEHGFDNKKGNGHVIGIYRWVDKYYLARIVNYGRRLMFEFVIPEPASFYLHAIQGKGHEGIDAEPPEEPIIMTGAGWRPLRPTDLNSSNYMRFISKYNVQDVEPYPAVSKRVGMAFAESSGSSGNTPIGKAFKELQIPDGYRATSWSGSWGWTGTENNKYVEPDFRIGGFGNNVNNLEGIIPVSVVGSLNAFAINVTVNCARKTETLTKWQLDTFEAIMIAYQGLLADYNEQVAVAEIQQGVEIEGRNPAINRRIEREELQKACLRLLTNEYAQTRVSGTWRNNELFNAMQSPGGAFGYPEFDMQEAIIEGKMIQFFEQAFEWDNMTYIFYPYFWGRKDNWLETFPIDDVDPKFRDFLRAGSARVAIPAHPAYAEVILHYLNTNEIWNGGEPPTLQDPLYISIVDEIKADTGTDITDDLPGCSVDSGYPCIVDEWEVKLPTSLVYLQVDAKLPDFTEEGD